MKTASKVLWYYLDIETDFTLAALSTGLSKGHIRFGSRYVRNGVIHLFAVLNVKTGHAYYQFRERLDIAACFRSLLCERDMITVRTTLPIWALIIYAQSLFFLFLQVYSIDLYHD